MAHETITLEAGTWELLTRSNTSLARIQNLGSTSLVVQATSDTTAPTSKGGAVEYQPFQGESFRLEDLFPGVSGANRLWGFMERAGRVSVSF